MKKLQKISCECYATLRQEAPQCAVENGSSPRGGKLTLIAMVHPPNKADFGGVDFPGEDHVSAIIVNTRCTRAGSR